MKAGRPLRRKPPSEREPDYTNWQDADPIGEMDGDASPSERVSGNRPQTLRELRTTYGRDEAEPEGDDAPSTPTRRSDRASDHTTDRTSPSKPASRLNSGGFKRSSAPRDDEESAESADTTRASGLSRAGSGERSGNRASSAETARLRAEARRANAPRTGTITMLEVQKRNKERINVYLDEEYAFSVTLEEAMRLRKGQALTEADTAALLGEDSVNRAVEAGINFLSYRPRSRGELEKKLLERAEPEQVARALERLAALGYLNDEAFAAMWVRERMQFKPMSPQALRYELRGKGVGNEVIASVLADVDAEDTAYRALQSQVRKVRALPPREMREKLTAFLARRGFAYADAKRAIDRLFEEQALKAERDEGENFDDFDSSDAPFPDSDRWEDGMPGDDV